MELTKKQIEAISDALHERVQFFNKQGEESNKEVCAQIEIALEAAFMEATGGVHDEKS